MDENTDENNIEKIYPDLKSMDYIHPIIKERVIPCQIYPTYISKPNAPLKINFTDM